MVPDVVPTPKEDGPTDGEGAVAPSAVPTARRKFLTRGIAGGSVAALVAGKPVKTLAKAYCKFSGWNSVKVKKKKGGKGLTLSNAPKTCAAAMQPPKYYLTKTKTRNGITYSPNKWPTTVCDQNGGTHSISSSTEWKHTPYYPVSPSGFSTTLLTTIFSTYGTSCEAYMLAAQFAACNKTIPLTPQYVAQLWSTYGETETASLLSFFENLV